MAFEDEYRAYTEAITAALGTLRPGAEVVIVRRDELRDRLSELDPDLVLSDLPDPGGVLAWLELPTEASRPSVLRLGDRLTEIFNPTLDDLLSIVDRTEALRGLADTGRD